MMSTKAGLRQQMRRQRLEVSLSRRKEAACLAHAGLNAALTGKNLVLSYASFGSELDLWSLNTQLAQERRLVLPRATGDRLTLHQVTHLKHLISSQWGIQEPDPQSCPLVNLCKIETILVPGLAFDSHHHRLGFGKGFYDRLLKDGAIPTIGVGFKEQLLSDALPIQPWDVALSQLQLF